MKKIFIAGLSFLFLLLFLSTFFVRPANAESSCPNGQTCVCPADSPPTGYTRTTTQCVSTRCPTSAGFCYAPPPPPGGTPGCLATGTQLSSQDCSLCCSKACTFITNDYYCSSGGCSVGYCYSSCPADYPKKENGICYRDGSQGVCCSASAPLPPPDKPGTGTWGAPGSGPSLNAISNLLGVGAPKNAVKTNFSSAAGILITLLIIIAIVLSLLFIIWGGIDWITSGGDKQKLQSARHKIVFALVGLVIVFVSFFIINAVYYFLGLGGRI